jgi:Acetyltransferase (GNAT) domain
VSNPTFEVSADVIVPRAVRASVPREDPAAEGLSIQAYGPEIPATLLAAAERSADNPYSCLAVYRAFEPQSATVLRHLVITSADRVLGILSYHERGSSLFIVNRLLGFNDSILDRCVSLLFATHQAARRIVIEGVYEGEARLRYRTARRSWCAMENLLLDLPASFEQYMGHFGPKTRKNLRYCAKRFQRENPGAEFAILTRDVIDEATVNSLVGLNHLRMESKGRTSGVDAKFAAALLTLGRSHGIACVARDKDGKILGGTLCTRVGNGLSLQVIAHDPAFNHVRLGLLCLLKSIETGIASGATVFHFLWGDSQYKALFGAHAAPLLSYRYYRSWIHYVFAFRDWRDQIAQTSKRYARRVRAAHRRAPGY